LKSRHAAKVDANQPALIRAAERYARELGAEISIESLASCGDDVPDLLIGYRGRNLLVEVKNPAAGASRRALRPGQRRWHRAWKGQVAKVETDSELLALLREVDRSELGG